MGTEIATMTSVQEKVKERIQATFMDLIPPELWEGMVSAELNNFTKNELPKLVKQAASERLMALLKEELEKPEWNSNWIGGHELASEGLKKMLREISPDLIAALFGQLGQRIISSIRSGNYSY